GTKSFALLVHDPDAPTRSGWWHWVVYNIPADVTSLPAGAGDPKSNLMPATAVQGRTDFGTSGYGGPCPPPGKPHHYYFRLYALKVAKLDVPADATAAFIGFNVNANSLGKAQLLGLYGRGSRRERQDQRFTNSQTLEITTEPSPTEEATRLTEPARTSPTAKIPGIEVAKGESAEAGPAPAPVITNPLSSSFTRPDSHSELGAAPTMMKSARVSTWRVAPVFTSRMVSATRCSAPCKALTSAPYS